MDDTTQPITVHEPNEEDTKLFQVIDRQETKYTLTPKFRKWEELFLDKSNKETFGNATQSAIQAYNLNPVTQYNVAGVMGHDNLKKHKDLARKYYEKQGITPGKLLDVMYQMMLAKKDTELLFHIAGLMGVPLGDYKPITKPGFVINQTKNELNIGGEMSVSFIKDEDTKTDVPALEAEIVK